MSFIDSIGGIAGLVRYELRRLPGYHLEQTPCRHKLDQNEVPWDLPRRIKERVAADLLATDWARYPDFHADELRRELGRLHDWPWEGVLVGNGSNELLALALEALASPTGEVLTVEPSFGLYPMFITRAGWEPAFIPPRPDLSLPIEELLEEVTEEPEHPVLLCSPNNPTGAAASPEQVEALLAKLEAPLLLDNAYGEFCRHDYRPLLHRHPHLLLFRTFSKAWSLAGLRLGYLLAQPELVAELIKVKLPYNVNHASAAAGRAVLAERAESERRVRVMVARRAQWQAMLEEAGLRVYPSEANFLLARCGEWGSDLHAAGRRVRDGLAARGILVRDVGRYPGLAGCLRVSVGSGAALRATRRALAEIAETPETPETPEITEPAAEGTP